MISKPPRNKDSFEFRKWLESLVAYVNTLTSGTGGTTDHSALSHLAYADSGHTGFQPAGSYLTAETDPVFTAHQAHNITATHISVLNNTSGTNTGDQVIPDQLSDLSEDATHRLVTDAEKSTWNGKQDALGFTAENVANKKTSLTDNSDTYYPSQKAVKTAVDAKVTANVAISGATKTKITYDTKGLVTGGADATTADIADSTDKRYCTDAQKTALHAAITVSGENFLSLTGQAITANKVSLANMATLAANSIMGNNTGAAATPLALTVAQVKALLAITAADVGAQPADAQLTDIAGLTATAGKVLTTNGTNIVNSVGYSNAAGNNTIVQRTSAGYILTNYVNLSGTATTTAPSHIIVETGTDGYTRRQPIANFRTNLAATASNAGFMPALSGNASQVLTGAGTWVNAIIPAGGYRDFVMAEGSVTHVALASAATYDASGNFKHWSFPKAATAVDTMVDFQFVMPPSYTSTHTLTALIFYRMNGATSGNIVVTSAIKCVTSGDAVALESKAFATANSTTNAIPGTAGYGKSFTTTMTNKDSVAAGDLCVLRVLRDADSASDTTTATNYLQVTGVQLYWQ